MTNDWRPLLDAAARERARTTIERIAADLAAIPPDDPATLAEGTAGTALLFGYLAHCFPGCGYEEVEECHLQHALGRLARGRWEPGLHDGLAGVAFAVRHLTDSAAADELLAGVDHALATAIGEHLGGTTLGSGLVGLGVYFLDRNSSGPLDAISETVVERLLEQAQAVASGLAWFTAPHAVWPVFRTIYPAGYYELGCARGAAGIIGFLARAAAQSGSAAEGPLTCAIQWLLRMKLPAEMRSCFGFYVLPDQQPEPKPSKAGWCGGDPGIAAALSLAGELHGRADWRDEALVIARRLARRSELDAAVMDASLCHGTAGIAHVLNRLYQRTGDEEVAAGARRWLMRTLEYATGGGVGGYQFYKGGWKPLRGLLAGAAGVALVLLAAISDLPPDWDRALLLSASEPVPGAA